MNIYVFGNKLIPEDSQVVTIIPSLEKKFPHISFIHADPTGNWWRGDRNFTIIDTVLGINSVTIFTSLEKIEATKSITVHDYDLYMDIQLMKKLKKIDTFTIIGVPVSVPDVTFEVSRVILKIIFKPV